MYIYIYREEFSNLYRFALYESTSTFWNFFELRTQTLGAKALYFWTANHSKLAQLHGFAIAKGKVSQAPTFERRYVCFSEREKEYRLLFHQNHPSLYLPKKHNPRLSTHFLGVLPLHEIPTQPTWFSFSPKLFITFQLVPWHHKLPSDLTIPKLRENTTFPMALLIGSPLVMWDFDIIYPQNLCRILKVHAYLHVMHDSQVAVPLPWHGLITHEVDISGSHYSN